MKPGVCAPVCAFGRKHPETLASTTAAVERGLRFTNAAATKAQVHPRCTYSAFAGRPQHLAQNLSSKDGGASGLGIRDRIECGHADCPPVSPGVAVSGESDIGGFFGGSTTVCGRCSLRVAGLILVLGTLAACFGISAGGIRRVSGAYPSSSSPSPVKFTGSNHRKMLTFRSSIAAHPARPKPADKVKETSATRA